MGDSGKVKHQLVQWTMTDTKLSNLNDILNQKVPILWHFQYSIIMLQEICPVISYNVIVLDEW